MRNDNSTEPAIAQNGCCATALSPFKFRFGFGTNLYYKIKYYFLPKGAIYWRFKLDDGTFLEIRKSYDGITKDLK
jgi:hypothetical protein